MPEIPGREFIVQWHLTARCEQRCKHCYMFEDEAFQEQLKNELSFDYCMKTLHDLHGTVEGRLNRKLRINFSGGDPMLRDDFWEIFSEARKLGIITGILGNPHLLNDESARKFFDLGLTNYQLSIDGMEDVHDQIRGKGSFEKTLKAIGILKKHRILTQVMFTISRFNQEDLLSVADLCGRMDVDVFAFDSMVPVGNADIDLVLSAQEIRNKMLEYLQFSWRKRDEGVMTQYRHKSNLWTLLESEMGLETRLVVGSRISNKIIAGCTIGICALSILSDGTVLPCRRLPLSIGKFPEQNFVEVFFGEKLNGLRQEHKLEECGSCSFLNVCRGCRAMAYAVNGSYFAPDPHCWANSQERR